MVQGGTRSGKRLLLLVPIGPCYNVYSIFDVTGPPFRPKRSPAVLRRSHSSQELHLIPHPQQLLYPLPYSTLPYLLLLHTSAFLSPHPSLLSFPSLSPPPPSPFVLSPFLCFIPHPSSLLPLSSFLPSLSHCLHLSPCTHQSVRVEFLE